MAGLDPAIQNARHGRWMRRVEAGHERDIHASKNAQLQTDTAQ
jgi:hypothetical protein